MGTRTPNYDLYIPGQGEEAWDDEVGGNFTTIDAALQALADTIDGAVYQINNVTYVASNARWNGSAWNRVDTGRPAVRMMLNSTTGILEIATAAAGANPITWTTIQVFSATGLDMKSKKVYNLATPTAASDAATKAYIDGLIAALKLSQIAIDADKNWNGKSITNVNQLAAVSIGTTSYVLVAGAPGTSTQLPLSTVCHQNNTSQWSYGSGWATLKTSPPCPANQSGVVNVRYNCTTDNSFSYARLLKNGAEIGQSEISGREAIGYYNVAVSPGDTISLQTRHENVQSRTYNTIFEISAIMVPKLTASMTW